MDGLLFILEKNRNQTAQKKVTEEFDHGINTYGHT